MKPPPFWHLRSFNGSGILSIMLILTNFMKTIKRRHQATRTSMNNGPKFIWVHGSFLYNGTLNSYFNRRFAFLLKFNRWLETCFNLWGSLDHNLTVNTFNFQLLAIICQKYSTKISPKFTLYHLQMAATMDDIRYHTVFSVLVCVNV